MSTVKLKRSAVPGRIPTTGQLELGEVAINTHDGKMYLKKDANGAVSVIEVGGIPADSATNVLYVSKSGNDSNDGSTIGFAKASIESALSAASTGTTIFVKSGEYTLNNSTAGITVPSFVSLVGDNLRTTSIKGSNANNDLFYVNQGCYLTNFTFKDHANGAAAISFPPGGAGNVQTSPYVENCTSFTSAGGTGMKIDGSRASGLKSMVSDSFTQINAGGNGIHLLNEGYAQLVSIFTVSCDVGILAESGGQCSLTNSNCAFGNFGLKATGAGSSLYQGTTQETATANVSQSIKIGSLTNSQVPRYGDVMSFNGISTFYTVESITDTGSGTYQVTFRETLVDDIGNNVTVDFHQRSLITASSITFEYVGTGTGFYDTPQSGAFPIQANEVVQDSNNQGQVYFTSTDQRGDFRIGGDLSINRTDGIIEGETFDRSLFAIMTPYILALEGN